MKKLKRLGALMLVFGMLCTMLPEIAYTAALPEDAPKEENQEEMDFSLTKTEPQADTEQIETVEAAPRMLAGQEAKIEEPIEEVGVAIDDYAFLTVGNPLSRTGVASNETFAFYPDTAGWYHLKAESAGGISITAARSYLENGREIINGWYWMGDNQKAYDKVFYCAASDTCLFQIVPSNGQATDYTVSVDTAEISSIEAAGEWGSAYPGTGLDYSGMQLKLKYADGTSTITGVIGYGSIEAFENAGLGGNYYFNSQIWIEYYTQKDSSVPGERYYDLWGLEDGTYTAHAFIERYENGNSKKFEFVFDVVLEQDAVESITVLSAEKTEFTKGFSEYLGEGKVTIQVHYKDGRAPKQISSHMPNSGLILYLEHKGMNSEWIDEYLKNGGALGRAEAHVAYRGVEAVYPITISDNPYSRMEAELQDAVYYAGCSYTFGDNRYMGEYLDPWQIVKQITLYYKDSGRAPETYPDWNSLPDAGRRNGGAGLLLKQSVDQSVSPGQPGFPGSYQQLYTNVDEFLSAGGTLGKNIYRVNYAGVTKDIEVEIRANPYSKVEVLTPPAKTTYREGKWGSLRTEGMVLRAYHAGNPAEYTDVAIPNGNDGSLEHNRIFRRLAVWLGGHNDLQYLEVGTHKASVFYYGHLAEFSINIVKSPISNFKIQPAQTEYLAGYQMGIDISGLKMSFQLENQTYADLVYGSEEYNELCRKYEEWIEIDTEKVNFNKAGTYPVKIIYMGASAEYSVTVREKIVKSLEIITAPSKTTYYAGETDYIFLDGMELEVTGFDGKKTKYKAYYGELEGYGNWYDLTDYRCHKLDVSAVKYDTPGIYEAVFHYGGASDTFLVEITESPVASLEIKQMPEKTNYYYFEAYNMDLKGLQFIVHYKDGTDYTAMVTESQSSIWIPYQTTDYWMRTSWKNGNFWDEEANKDNAIVLSFLGAAAEIPVKLEKDPITEIRVAKNPKCMAYPPIPNVTPDLYGAEFEISYLDGSKKTMAILQHVSEAAEEKYRIRLSSYFDYWNNHVAINIAGRSVSIPLESFDFAKAGSKDLTENQNQGGILTKDQPYQILKFVPKETKQYSFFYMMGHDKTYGWILDASGKNLDCEEFWNNDGIAKKRELKAKETYYLIVQGIEFGKETSYLCCISSTKDAFSLRGIDIAKFEVTKAPKTKFYTFEKNLYESNVPVDNLEYRITCKDGTVLCGRVRGSYAFGMYITGRFKNLTENGMADTSKENAIRYQIVSWDTDGSNKTEKEAEKEVPVTFDAVSPVASITLNQSPWKIVSQDEAYDALYRTKGLALTIRYIDGTSKSVVMQDDYSTWINDSYPYSLELAWKNTEFYGMPKAGGNAIVISYMGSSTEAPVQVNGSEGPASKPDPIIPDPTTPEEPTPKPPAEDLPGSEIPTPKPPTAAGIAEAALTLDIPKAGEMLPEAKGEEGCTADVTWINAEKGQMAEFAKAYRAKILLTPKKDSVFTENTIVRLNGRKTSSKIFNRNDGTITILFTFPYTDCSVTVPEVKGYALDESANEAKGRAPYGKTYAFRYEKTDESAEALVVKADGRMLKPDQDGNYILTEIKSNMTVIAKSIVVETKEEFARLDFYNKETLSDSFFAEKNNTVAASGEEDVLPMLESYADGSKDFFFGWYQDKDNSLNGIGKRFCSTTKIPNQDVLPLYAKWGLGIFSCIYNTKQVNYKVLSIDEDNRMKVQIGDGSSLAIKESRNARGIEAVGDNGTFAVPSSISNFKGTGLDELGIEFAGCSVTAIAENAFRGAEDIRKISLPNTITEIGAGAFGGCKNLEGIEIPSSVKQIKRGTFNGCTSLKNVVLSDGIKAIDGNVFEGCTSLKSVVIPDSVQNISTAAFAGAGSSGLKLVCSSSVSEIAKAAAAAAGAVIQTVDVSFDCISENQEFTYGDEPLAITAGVEVNGSQDKNRTAGLSWQIEEGMDQYYQITVKANRLIVEPKEATDGNAYRITAKDTISGQTKSILCSTSAAFLEAAAEAEEIPAASYTGSPIEPEVILTLVQNGKRLVKGKDYEVTYQNNIEAGTKAAAIITGIHNYFGEITRYFTIQQGYETGNVKRVESIELDYESLVLRLHSRKSLVAEILPWDAENQDITWESSDDSVVTVDKNGVVEAASNGMAVITAEADGQMASCKVTVPYSISYKLNGGKNHEFNPYVYYSNTVKLRNPSRENYIFGGWYADSSMKDKITEINANDGRDYTLYAKWIKISLGKPAVDSIKNAKPKRASVRFKKVNGAYGYELIYSVNKRFKKSQTKMKLLKKTDTELTRLAKGKIYYVKVRAFQVDSTGAKVYGKWSSSGRVRITK